MITRRHFNSGLVTGSLAAGGLFVISGGTLGSARAADILTQAFAAIERESGGRLGVAIQDERDGSRFLHRADERFAMCSTFKMLVVAATLKRVDVGTEQLDRQLRFFAADVIPGSPISKDRVAEGMTVTEACAAAITVSDNTAGNLLLASIGGPAGLTAFARSIGDMVTRLDRIEPELNEATPGDERDTTTPAAMLADLQALTVGNVLSAASRERLIAWLVANKTGGLRLRAGLPRDWRVGDKTGLGGHGSNNDIGIAWPPRRPPILFSVYLTQTQAPLETRNAALASVARAVVGAVGG